MYLDTASSSDCAFRFETLQFYCSTVCIDSLGIAANHDYLEERVHFAELVVCGISS